MHKSSTSSLPSQTNLPNSSSSSTTAMISDEITPLKNLTNINKKPQATNFQKHKRSQSCHVESISLKSKQKRKLSTTESTHLQTLIDETTEAIKMTESLMRHIKQKDCTRAYA